MGFPDVKDLTLIAEVHRYHCAQAGYEAKEAELAKKMDKLDKIAWVRRDCIVQLQRANAITHIKAKPRENPETPAVASLYLDYPENNDKWVEVLRCWEDDFPAHVLGSAYWNTSPTDPHGGYHCVVGQQVFLLEFINNAWHFVERHFDTDLGHHIHRTRRSTALDRENALDLGWWLPEDEANPDRLPPAVAPVPAEEPQAEEQLEYIDKDISLDLPLPDPIEELTEAFCRLTPIHVNLALVESSAPTPMPTVPTVPLAPCTTPVIVPMATAPLTGALKGTPPTLFAGSRVESDQFLWEFHLYHKLNRDHGIMQNPYSHIICALSFICGPSVNNWVDIEEQKLDALITRAANPVAKTDEQLWTTFEASFKAAWTDTLSKQNAYQKLTTLQMKGDDVDTYISQFEYLASAAEWHRDASRTVEFFCCGLTETLLRACILRTTPPKSMTEWQDTACAEAQRVKSSHHLDPVPITSNITAPPPVPPIDGVIPMDVDAISTSRPHNPPLSDTERDQSPRNDSRSLTAFFLRIATWTPPPPQPRLTLWRFPSPRLSLALHPLALRRPAPVLFLPSAPPRVSPSLVSRPSTKHLVPPIASPPRTPSPAPTCTSPPPRPPHSPLRLASPCITLPFVVEDDNQPIGGVKTIEASVLTPETIDQTPPHAKVTYYLPLFQPRTCENPRDPDKIAPITPVTRYQNRAQHASHPKPQIAQRPASPRPPDISESTRHDMV
ncbi:hypothetical protein EDB92DRAFT_1944462 [Lactarius akahatsu]|uniref:Retrotransposon gag domain-containing protein n=1 Tax=Lactarius akahatsu TaxID=416441 RepID=A0AAD4QEM3_9AGAM|nr:hypothetical protein EDB92DRAFT_1944462 [Lactarius akahatsu]